MIADKNMSNKSFRLKEECIKVLVILISTVFSLCFFRLYLFVQKISVLNTFIYCDFEKKTSMGKMLRYSATKESCFLLLISTYFFLF